MNEITTDQVDALIARSGEPGCVNLSHLNELVQEQELEDEDIRALYEQLEERGIEVSDDCGKQSAGSTYVNGDLAVATTDALQLFLNEAGRWPLLTKEEEIELAQLIEKGKEAEERLSAGRVRSDNTALNCNSDSLRAVI